MSQRLTDQLLPLFTKAFEEYPEITWEITLVVLPDGDHGQLSAFLALYTQIPGAVVNSTIRANTMLDVSGQTQETINEVAAQVKANLTEGRSKQLETMEQQAAEASGNGKQTPYSGLIIPT